MVFSPKQRNPRQKKKLSKPLSLIRTPQRKSRYLRNQFPTQRSTISNITANTITSPGMPRSLRILSKPSLKSTRNTLNHKPMTSSLPWKPSPLYYWGINSVAKATDVTFCWTSRNVIFSSLSFWEFEASRIVCGFVNFDLSLVGN